MGRMRADVIVKGAITNSTDTYGPGIYKDSYTEDGMYRVDVIQGNGRKKSYMYPLSTLVRVELTEVPDD